MLLALCSVPLTYDDDKRKPKITLPIPKPQTAEEKRKCIKTLIEKIPTAKEELFTYALEWKMVDSVSEPIAAVFRAPLH